MLKKIGKVGGKLQANTSRNRNTMNTGITEPIMSPKVARYKMIPIIQV